MMSTVKSVPATDAAAEGFCSVHKMLF